MGRCLKEKIRGRAVRYKVIALCSALLVATVVGTTQSAAALEPTTESLWTLPSPMTPQQATDYALNRGASAVKALQIDYDLNGSLHTMGIPLTGKPSNADVMGTAALILNGLSAMMRLSPHAPAQVPATTLDVNVKSADILRGRQDVVARVEVVEGAGASRTLSRVAQKSGRELKAARSTLACNAAWLPDHHLTRGNGVGQGRSVYQENQWYPGRMANLKCLSDTYEAEFKTYNYDGRHYYSLSSGDVLGWDTNFPRGYLDTGAFDSSNEPQYTIGSADIDAATAYTTYTTYIQVRLGNVDVDAAKTQGQRGNRTPNWCYSTWCIFADDTNPQTPGWWTLPGEVHVDR